MKKVLYMNLLYNNSGQRRMDQNIIDKLVEISDVYVVCSKGWYIHENAKAKYIYYEPTSMGFKGKKAHFIKEINNLIFAKKLYNKYQFDTLFFASFETSIFLFSKILFQKFLNDCFIVHNNNIDRFNAVNLKKKHFSKYMNRVNHIVLEKFIGDYLEKEGVDKNRIYVLPHPLNINYSTPKEYDCVGISNSNSEELISSIINYERHNNLVRLSKCKILLRSKNYNYDDGYLKVFSGWLSDDKYNQYISSAKRLYIPFPSSFQYRVSGSIVDAFSNHIPVIGSDIPLLRYYQKEYGNICVIVSSPKDFIKTVIDFKNNNDNENSFMKFFKDHGDEALLNSLTRIINHINYSVKRS